MSQSWRGKMQIPDTPVSLADLSAAGVRLRADEAVTLVRELLLQVERGDVAGVPSAHVIRLSSTGVVSVEGPVAAGGRPVERAAQLLDALLAPAGSEAHGRVPGGLKLVLARGLGTLDLPRFVSLADFTSALSRFAVSDPAAMVTSLVVRWSEAVASRPETDARVPMTPQPSPGAQIERFAPLEHAVSRAHVPHTGTVTISDIRRARRATGLTLLQIAEKSGIAVGMLRQLEWGYLLNWPAGPQSRLQLIRYARAAGLDEQLVVATVTPLMEQAASLRPLIGGRSVRATEWRDGAVAPPAVVAPEFLPALQRSARRSRLLATLAIPALLALAVLPVWWSLQALRSPAPSATSVAVSRPDTDGGGTRQPDAARSSTPAVPDRLDQAPSPALTGSGDSQAAATSGARWADRPVADESRAPHDAVPVAARTSEPFPVTGGAGWPSPLPASIGTAMFYEPDGGLEGALGESGAAHLKVTKIVDDAANNFHVRPSPDGSRIAFDSDRDGQRAVYVADNNGHNLRRVSPPGAAALPSWAPDSRRLVFVARGDAEQSEAWDLWMLDVESGALRRVTEHKQGVPWGASWFPRGDRLAYAIGERLIVRDLSGDRERVFRSPRKGRAVFTPAVSPDGRLIVFRVAQDGAWLLNVADGSMRRVLDDPTADEYVWSPDGKQLAYYSARAEGWSVWRMAPR